jgi:hypothetical protein
MIKYVNEVTASARLLKVMYLTNPNEIYKYFTLYHVSHIGCECCRVRVRAKPNSSA